MSGPDGIQLKQCTSCGGATLGVMCTNCALRSKAEPVTLHTCPTCPGITREKGKACSTCVALAVKTVGEAAAILDESPEEIAQREAAARPYPGCIDPRLQADTTEALEAKFDADLVELAKLIEEHDVVPRLTKAIDILTNFGGAILQFCQTVEAARSSLEPAAEKDGAS